MGLCPNWYSINLPHLDKHGFRLEDVCRALAWNFAQQMESITEEACCWSPDHKQQVYRNGNTFLLECTAIDKTWAFFIFTEPDTHLQLVFYMQLAVVLLMKNTNSMVGGRRYISLTIHHNHAGSVWCWFYSCSTLGFS